MKYKSQTVAKPYFIAALLLFAVQIAFGLISGLQYVRGDFLFPNLPFDVSHMVHTNSLIMLLFLTFMGSAYYMVSEETETELVAPWLAWIIFWLFLATALATLAGYVALPYAKLAELTKNDLFPTMGRKYLEQPTIAKLSFIVLMIISVLQLFITAWRGRKTGINTIMLIGLASTTVVFALAFYNPNNLVLSKFYRWWVVHLWIRCTWELMAAAMLAFLLIRITGVHRNIIEKWLYLISAAVLVSGLIGVGQHYYWIGAPDYWYWWGSVFSALEPVPMFMMTVFAFNMLNLRNYEHPNKAALLWTIGSTVVTFLGAGIGGFIHTLAPINYYTHGTQITVAHSHMLFYGTYIMLSLAMISYAVPTLYGHKAKNERAQVVEMWSFWLMTVAMTFITLFLATTGVLQVYLQRYTDNPQPFMVVQERIALFYWMRELAGLALAIGFVIYLASFFVTANQHKKHKPHH
ncbi:nitric oxide reductase [Achromatium sp. WMS2]|nr:nitric oxide reductase [Achromatium sp. WMS2]